MSASDLFYEQLPDFSGFSQFSQLDRYRSLPMDWLVVITDIEGSTKAIQQGLYKEVNSISTASVVVMLNALAPLKVPYVFGGDGATVCIPSSRQESVASALVAARRLADESFGLQLRIGMVPMSVIQQAGCHIHVGKYRPSAHFQQAMFQGDGLRYAESLVKATDPENPYILDEDKIEAKGSFEGFECRWNEVPSSQDETVSIIVQVINQEVDAERMIYEDVSKKIVKIYGNEKKHHPLLPEKLTLSFSPGKLSIEAGIRTAFQGAWKRLGYLLKLWFLVCAGKYFMDRNIKSGDVDWGRYKQRLIANTDYRKFDEILRMVISGTCEQRDKLTDYLERLHHEGKIIFGIHASPAAVITCMVFDYDTEHIHFLDGSNGGYAMAAKKMKQQLKETGT